MAASADSGVSLGELAQRFGLKLRGDAALRIEGLCALAPGKPGCLSFCADSKLRPALLATRAAAVVLAQRQAEDWPGPALIAPDPALAFARIAALFDRSKAFQPGVHPSASVAPGAAVGAGCWIGPQTVIEDGASVGENCFIGPHCVVRRGAAVGAGSRLEARVYLGERCRLGERAQVQPGAVIGGRGFGLARDQSGWIEVPQLAAVVVGNDVEIGANTCIDRGALDDTVIEDGVKLDNLIQIAHNCRIGAHTAVAACVGIAGSVTIGKRCMIGGACGISGHLSIGDDVVLLARTDVSKSLPGPGVYGGGTPARPVREWRKELARIRRLGRLDERLKAIEKKLDIKLDDGEADEPDDL